MKSQFGEKMVGQFRSQKRRSRPHGAKEICAALKTQIEEGVYQPGAALPSTRALATEFGASRTTITAAYDQLIAEGFIETKQGRRSRVALKLRSGPHTTHRSTVVQGSQRLSAFGRRLTHLTGPPAVTAPLRFDFRYGDIAAADFPQRAWRSALTNALTTTRSPTLRYQEPQGSTELRAALQAYLWRARSLRCSIDQIIVVNGSQQGLDLSARLLLDTGDRFVIENPCYWAARYAFESVGASPYFVAVDQDGLCTDHLKGIKSAELCYVTPSHQFPLGHVLSAARRSQLLLWARRSGTYVIEDDYDGEFRYDVRPIQPLYAFDDSAKVIYLGTISKTLSPLLRVGYLVVPQALIDGFRTAKRLADRHTSILEQAALADLIQSGAYERHVRRLRRKNAERRTALLHALAEYFGDAVELQGSEAGLHVVVWFNEFKASQEVMLAERARQKGVGIYPVSGLYGNHPESASRRRAGFVFGYAALDEGDIRTGVARLSDTLRLR
jgi:GntR family transcriptional regulator/MocR family aminotransferase